MSVEIQTQTSIGIECGHSKWALPMVYRPIIFKGDDVFTYYSAGHREWIAGDGKTTISELVPGSYVLLIYDIGYVGRSHLGVQSLTVRSLHIDRTAKLPEGASEWSEAKALLLAMAGQEAQLSENQRKLVVAHIKSEYHYWWDNASPAIKAFLLGKELSPEDKAKWLLIEGTSLYYGNRLSEAARLVEDGLKLDLKLSGARCRLGQIALYQGDIQGAITYFQEELELAREPDDYTAHSYLSVIYQAQGRIDDARFHSHLAKQTRTYLQHPMYLAPGEVERIRRAVRGTSVSQEHPTKPKPWWKRVF